MAALRAPIESERVSLLEEGLFVVGPNTILTGCLSPTAVAKSISVDSKDKVRFVSSTFVILLTR